VVVEIWSIYESGLFSDQNCISLFSARRTAPLDGDILKNSCQILRQPLGWNRAERTNRMKPTNSLGRFHLLFAFMFSKGANEISFTEKLLPTHTIWPEEAADIAACFFSRHTLLYLY